MTPPTLLEADYEAPSKVSLRTAFTVKIVLRIDSVPLAGHWEHYKENFLPLAHEDMRQRFRVSLRMGGEGIDFDPEGERRLDQSLSATWSLRASDWGSYIGIIRTVVDEIAPRVDPAVGSPFIYEALDDLEFGVEIEEPPRSLPVALGPVVLLVGLATSITGLVVFFWKLTDRRREREKQERVDEEQKPVILDSDGRPL